MFNDISFGNVHCPCKDCKHRGQTCDKDCKLYKQFKIDLIEFRRQEHIQNIMRGKVR